MDEGVIKFNLHHTKVAKLYFGQENKRSFVDLLAWRKKLFDHDVIGCDVSRYGACYGNISMRYVESALGYVQNQLPGRRTFLISGTQTGGLESITSAEFVRIVSYDVRRNRVHSEGPIHPSSETLTHAALYDLDPQMGCIIHTHDPELWQRAAALGLPTTGKEVAYGTQEMALEMKRLYSENFASIGILAMAGHLDGIIAVGSTPHEAGTLLAKYMSTK